MADSNYMQGNTTTGGDGWQAIKLRDLGDGTYGLVQVDIGAWDKAHISTATTTVIKSGAGILGSIIINKAIALSAVTIYDGTNAQGTVIGIITQPLALLSSQRIMTYNCKFSTGLTIVTSSTDDITITYM